MKKLISILLSLVFLLSMAACQPTTEQPANSSTNAPTETPTETPTDPSDNGDIIVDGDPTDPEPTDPEPTDPAGPAEMPESGYCAVGVLNAEAGTAKVLADNGAVAEIAYTSEVELRTGMVYAFAKNGDTYTLSPIAWINGDAAAWAVRTYDNSGIGAPDQLYTNDGVNETLYDLAEDCVVFCRFSDTEYRIFRGSDVIMYSDWPCDMYFDGNENPNGGNLLVSAILVVDVDTTTWVDSHANESTTFFFDPEGFGWSNGDLIIE